MEELSNDEQLLKSYRGGGPQRRAIARRVRERIQSRNPNGQGRARTAREMVKRTQGIKVKRQSYDFPPESSSWRS